MMKRFLIIAAVICLLVSCSNPPGNNPNNKPENKTFIVFNNTQGICTALVYEDYRRQDDDKIAEIPAGKSSEKIEWSAGESVPFYFSYRVTIKGINDFSLNYVPEIGRDQKQVRIDADVTTNIKIPALSESISSPDTLLSNNSYIFIQNNSIYSFELHRGNSKVKPDNISSSLINDGEKAQYTINPGPASNYQLLVGADYKEFSGSIVNFEAGHIYNFDFNGNISLIKDIELKLENVNGFTIPQPPATPVVITSNRSISLRWTAVESATAYEIWMSTVNDSASAAKHGTDIVASLSTTISGLNNGTTYYIWLKAKNNMGTSGFSPVANGTPSAATVKPPDPQTMPVVIAGNGYLSVSWQAVIDADFYEVWAGTTNNTQSATKRGEDVSELSAIITGLNNGTSYYVWIKAKNNIGISGFSPFANGKPLDTPGMPTVSPGYKQLLITWTAVAGTDEYEVYYGIDTPTTLAVTTTVTTATISGLTNGTTYYIRLRAKNAHGVSDYGQSASGMPNNNLSAGLYRGAQKIGNQNLVDSLAYISTNAVNGDEYYIILGANESIAPQTLSYSPSYSYDYDKYKTVGITLFGYGEERTITLSSNGSMFTVGSFVTLTLDENISLVGRSTNNASLININGGGNLIMNEGAKITNNTFSHSSAHGGGVSSLGTFIMNGGEISGNTITAFSNYGEGGGVYSPGYFTMNGGKITGNTASSASSSSYGGSGGGVWGGITLYGGEISENTADVGGGIYCSSNTTINGGKITKNTARGGGIYIGANGTVTMNSGTISGNNSNSQGSGIEVQGTFNMYGGIISGNSSKNYGGGIFINGIFKKLPPSGVQESGIIYGSEAVGVDADGIPLKNTSSSGATVYSSSYRRNITAEQTDQIDSTTGKGLSLNGNPPFGQ